MPFNVLIINDSQKKYDYDNHSSISDKNIYFMTKLESRKNSFN